MPADEIAQAQLAQAVTSQPEASARDQLAAAVQRNDRRAALALLEENADVNAPQPDGMTALHWAAYHDDADIARRLVDRGADAGAKNRYGVTPLSIACANGGTAILELLLDAGADPNTTLSGGETALMTAARTGKLEPVQALLDRGADPNAKERAGQTAVMWAAAEGHGPVVDALIKSGADFRSPLKSGFTPFFFAVREGRRDVVRRLLDAGIHVNDAARPEKSTNTGLKSGTSPLLLAVENGHFELAAELLEAGADPNDSRRGFTALHAITWVRKPIRGDGDPPPIGSGNLDSLQFVRKLFEHGAAVDPRHGKHSPAGARLNRTGATPFLLAAESSDVALLRLLVELGADPTISNADGTTPLLAAAGVGVLGDGDESAGTEEEAIQTAELLLELGADINAVDDNGNTVMHGAAYQSRAKLVRVLAARGADAQVWNQKNKRGWTPLLIAQGHRPGNFRPDAETIRALEQAAQQSGPSRGNTSLAPREHHTDPVLVRGEGSSVRGALPPSAQQNPLERRPILVPPAAPPRPNIIFILLDNVGQEWFGCYGSEENCTPHIDRLARTGVRVENCYTSVVCGPSRIMLLTGRYPHSTGFRLHHDAALYSGGGLDPQREVAFPRVFRDAGYATAITGKWQINNLYDEPNALAQHGFQEHLVWPGSINRDKLPASELDRFQDIVRRESYEEAVAFNKHIESRYWDPVFIRNGRRETLEGKFGPDESYAFAVDFLRRNRSRPFLLYLPMVLTHGQSFTENVVPTPRNRDRGRPHHEMFADMLRYADAQVGALVEELDRLELRDRTIVFVASDNGTEKNLRARRNGRVVQGDLYSLSEAGGNVVLLANSPTLIPGGRTLPLADFTDIYPTLCDLARVPLAEGHRLDGRSFASFLLGRPGAAPPRDWILNEYHETRVVRDTRFKLYSDGRLFDAHADPAEEHDLSRSTDTVVSGARERLRKVLDALPPDTPPPFPLRSLSAFKIRGEARAR